jgi:hypothetical protein
MDSKGLLPQHLPRMLAPNFGNVMQIECKSKLSNERMLHCMLSVSVCEKESSRFKIYCWHLNRVRCHCQRT